MVLHPYGIASDGTGPSDLPGELYDEIEIMPLCDICGEILSVDNEVGICPHCERGIRHRARVSRMKKVVQVVADYTAFDLTE